MTRTPTPIPVPGEPSRIELPNGCYWQVLGEGRKDGCIYHSNGRAVTFIEVAGAKALAAALNRESAQGDGLRELQALREALLSIPHRPTYAPSTSADIARDDESCGWTAGFFAHPSVRSCRSFHYDLGLKNGKLARAALAATPSAGWQDGYRAGLEAAAKHTQAQYSRLAEMEAGVSVRFWFKKELVPGIRALPTPPQGKEG